MSYAFNIPFKVERGGGVPTARDYVQDGLIALFDGIENAGWGRHDPIAAVWKDLVDDERWYDLNEYALWGADHITKADQTYAGWIGRINKPLPRAIGTAYGVNQIECVVEKLSTFGDRAVFLSLDLNTTANDQNTLSEAAADKWCIDGSSTSKPYVSIPVGEIVSLSGYSIQSMYKNSVEQTGKYSNNVSYGRGSLLGGANSASGYVARYGTLGRIYSIRVYNRALTPDEIASNYSVDQKRFNIP